LGLEMLGLTMGRHSRCAADSAMTMLVLLRIEGRLC